MVESSFCFLTTGEATLLNIRAAIKEWQDRLCINFKERQFEDDYIEFAYEGGYVEMVCVELVKANSF